MYYKKVSFGEYKSYDAVLCASRPLLIMQRMVHLDDVARLIKS
jgi:hypothetical protein